MFRRLCLEYRPAEWNGYDRYWVEGGGEEFVDALERWNQVHSL